jgi:hypothetical protein
MKKMSKSLARRNYSGEKKQPKYYEENEQELGIRIIKYYQVK